MPGHALHGMVGMANWPWQLPSHTTALGAAMEKLAWQAVTWPGGAGGLPPCMPAMKAATLRRSMAALPADRYSWPSCCSRCSNQAGAGGGEGGGQIVS